MEFSVNLPEKIVICRAYHAVPMDGERVLLTNGHDSFILKGKDIDRLLPDIMENLQESPDMHRLLENLTGTYAEDAVKGIVAKLLSRRVLREPFSENFDPVPVAESQKNYFLNFTNNPTDNLNRLHAAKVGIFGLGPLGCHFAVALAASGVGFISVCDPVSVCTDLAALSPFYSDSDVGQARDVAFIQSACSQRSSTRWERFEKRCEDFEYFSDFDYLVCCLEKYEPALLEKLNLLAVRSGTPFIWGCLDGHTGLVGPTVIPHETACFKCYETRVMSNVDHLDAHLAYTDYLKKNGNGTDFGYLMPHLMTLGGIISLEVIKDISSLTPPITYNAQLEINLLTMEYELHPVLKIPRCPVCSRLYASGPPVRPFMEKMS